MTEFSFDTSGVVEPSGREVVAYRWSDLSPFVQGYVEALFASIRYERASAGINKGDHVLKWDERVNYSNSRYLAFRDLDPSALALILRDCERWLHAWQHIYPEVMAQKGGDIKTLQRRQGAAFWKWRQHNSELDRVWPPLQPYLSDEGKVCLREAQ